MSNTTGAFIDHVSIIEEHRATLSRDLMTDIPEHLKKINVLTEEDYSYILGADKDYSEFTNEEFESCAERLLQIIISKSPTEIAKFVESLRESYPWLYELFPEKDMALEEALIVGNVPKKPKRHVLRKELNQKFRNDLMSLERGKYLVLHGMPGCGKSTLAAECLHDSSVLSKFRNVVIWVSIGESKESQNEESFCSMMQATVNCFLSQQVTLTGNVKKDLIEMKTTFAKSTEAECLLVLEDVRCQKMIKALDFGLKTVVITNDKSIMKDMESVSIEFEMPLSFTKEEALNLLAKGIQVSAECLPHEASTIYDITRGFPLSISLLAGYVEDHKEYVLANNTDFWKILRVKLEMKENGIKRHGISNEANDKINSVINIAVENMPNDKKELFKYFALFVEDINIKPQVLVTVWEKDVPEVEDILFKFVNKSLLVRKWVKTSYVYGIHDCILSYLKQTSTEEERKELHKKLLRQYRKKCPNGDFSKLPRDDNYIFFYLGYHFKNADELNEFPINYLNLEFIEAKLLTAGPVDLLSDYSEYRKYITDKQESTYDKVRDIQAFVERVGQRMFLNSGTKNPDHKPDIIQFIFQECPMTSFLYKTARQLAEQRSLGPNRTSYVQFPLGPVIKENNPQEMLPLKEGVSVLKVTNHPFLILIGYKNGNIQLYNICKKSSEYFYDSENSSVKGLSINYDSTYFLSYCTSNECVSIWPLFFEGKESSNGSPPNQREPRTPSPSRVQQNHEPMFVGTASRNGVHRVRTLSHDSSVTSARYSVYNPNLLATTTSTTLFMWKDNENIWKRDPKTPYPFCCVTFCLNDQSVIACTSSRLFVYGVAKGEPLRNIVTEKMGLIEYIFTDSENTDDVYMKTENGFCLWTFADNEEQEKPFSKFREPRQKNNLICTAVEFSKHIGMGYSDGCIEILDKQNCNVVLNCFKRPKSEVLFLSMDGERVVAYYSDSQLCVWSLSKRTKSTRSSNPPFALYWHDNKPVAATASMPSGALLVWKEHEVVHRVDDVGEFDLVALSPDEKMVAYWKGKTVTRTLLTPNAVAEPSTEFESAQRPAFLRVYGHGDDHLVLAGPTVGQLLVWHANNMRFLGRRNGTLKDAFLVKDVIVCIDTNGGIEVHSVIKEPEKDKVLEKIDRVKFARVGGARLALGYESKKLLILDIPSLDPLKEENLPAPCEDAAFSPDGSILVVSMSSGEIKVIKVQTGQTESVKLSCCVGASLAITDDGILCLRRDLSLCLVDLTMDSRHACSALRSPESSSGSTESSSPPQVIASSNSQFVTVDEHCSIQEVQFLSTQRRRDAARSKLASFFTPAIGNSV